MTERLGWLMLDGWAGRTNHTVVVVGETSQRFRIRLAPGRTLRIPGGRRGGKRFRQLAADATALVPKHAVTFTKPGQVHD